MADGRRPGGLTALAVLNFVFGGFDALAALATAALIGLSGEVTKADGEKLQLPLNLLYLSLALTSIAGALLITSGVGYLKQKRVLGRVLGNAYAVASLAKTAVDVFGVKNGSGIFTILFIIYPILTLILVNTTFKDDLVN